MKLKEMQPFFEHARSSGAVPGNTVHNWQGAIGAISRCLEDDEQTVEFLQGHPIRVRARIETVKPSLNRRTMDSYMARAATAISHFLAWKEDAERWQKETEAKPRRERGKQRGPRADKSALRLQALLLDGERLPGNQVRVPTEAGGTIKLEFPNHFATSDVLRVAWALAVHARDFDPEQVLKGFGKPPVMKRAMTARKLALVAEAAHEERIAAGRDPHAT